MKFKLSSAALSSRLSILSKVLGSKNVTLTLDCFLFEINGQQLTVTASDGENLMRTTLPLDEADEDISFLVSARTMTDSLRELPEQPVAITVDLEALTITVDYLNGHYNFTVLRADEYRPIEIDPTTVRELFAIESSVLSDNLTRTIFAAASEELRPVMNGVYFDLRADALAIVASDGHKLVRNRIFSITTDTPTAFVMPKKPATLLKTVLPHDETTVNVSYDGKMAMLVFGDTMLLCRLIEGRYPDYNAVIPQDNPNELSADRLALLGAMRRVTPFTPSNAQLVRMKLEPNKISLKSEDFDFYIRAVEELVCDYLGTPMAIGFKGSSFIDILSNMACDQVRLEMADPSRPTLILPEEQPEGQEVVMLIMPMLLND